MLHLADVYHPTTMVPALALALALALSEVYHPHGAITFFLLDLRRYRS